MDAFNQIDAATAKSADVADTSTAKRVKAMHQSAQAAHDAAKAYGAAANSFASYVARLQGRGFDTGDRNLDRYAQGIAQLVERFDQARKAGLGAAEATELFERGQKALAATLQSGMLEEQRQLNNEVAEYALQVRQAVAAIGNQSQMRINSMTMPSDKADLANQKLQLQAQTQAALDRLQLQHDATRNAQQ